MPDPSLRDILINRVLPRVQSPGQYIGGEWNSICKDRAAVRGRLCLAFPEPYTIGMSHYGLQVLYAIMNGRSDWACERVFTPLTDLESLLRERGLPLVSLESFTPLREFDVVGFSLQHELSATNVLTMLDLGGIPLAAEERTMADPLILAGGPGSANPEPMARFIDAFLLGDGEEALPAVCDLWLEMRHVGRSIERPPWPAWPRPCPISTCRGSTNRNSTPTAGRRDCGRLARRRAAARSSRPWCRISTPRWCPSAPIVPSSNAFTSGSPSRSCGVVRGDAASARAVP